MFSKSAIKQPTPPQTVDRPASPPGPRSPEREGLQLANSRRDKLKHELELVASELATLVDKRIAARAAITAAETGVEAAKTNAAHYLIQTAFGKEPPLPLTSKEARAALVDAQDALAVLLETETTLSAIKTEMERQLTTRDGQVREARDAVIRSDSAVQALCDRFPALQEQFLASREILDYLRRFRMLPPGTRFDAYGSNEFDLANDSPWRAFFSALESDADATIAS